MIARILRSLAAVLVLLTCGAAAPVAPAEHVAVFSSASQAPAQAPARGTPPMMPPIPVFPAADYNLTPLLTLRNGQMVDNFYQQATPIIHVQRVKALEYSIPDEQLRAAFNIAMSVSPDFHTKVAARFVYDGTWVMWDDFGLMAPNTWAQAWPAQHLILVNPELKDENVFTLAAVLAHEAYHIVFDDNVSRGAGCFQAETNAHNWESHIWERVAAHAVALELTNYGQVSYFQRTEQRQYAIFAAGGMPAHIASLYADGCAVRRAPPR